MTKACNFRCSFCDIWKIPKEEDTLTLIEQKKLLDDCSLMGVKLLHLCGGETLLYKDLYTLIEYGTQKDISIALTSNGSIMTEKNIDKLAKAGLKHLTISIDDYDRETHDTLRGFKGSHERALSALRYCKEKHPKIQLSINTIIHKKNFTHLIKMAELARKNGILAINFLPIQSIYPQNRFKGQNQDLFFKREDIPKVRTALLSLIQYLKKNKMQSMSPTYFNHIADYFEGKTPKNMCGRGNLVCEIDTKGNVYPCYGQPHIAGNIRKKSIIEIWHAKKFNRIRAELKDCSACWENCQIEPMIRFMPKHVIKEFPSMINEYFRYLR